MDMGWKRRVKNLQFSVKKGIFNGSTLTFFISGLYNQHKRLHNPRYTSLVFSIEKV